MKTSFRSKSGSYLLEAAVLLPVIIVISMMLLLLMLFLFGNAQDAADMGAEVRRAAGENSKTVEYDVQRDHRKFSLSGKYQNEVQTSEIISRSSGATDCYFVDTRRRGRFLSLFSFQADEPVEGCVDFNRRSASRAARRTLFLKPSAGQPADCED